MKKEFDHLETFTVLMEQKLLHEEIFVVLMQYSH